MDKEVCFFINGKALFLDKGLVSFNDTPIFFVCCDSDKNYYLALCTDIDNLEYIIVDCSLKLLHQMLSGKIEMRMPFISSKQYWNVKTGTSAEEDEVLCLNSKQMDVSVLPYPKAYYEAKKKEDKDYVEEIAAAYLLADSFNAIAVVPNAEEIAKAMLEVSLNVIPKINQYIDIVPDLRDTFTGITKDFVVPAEENGFFLYAEYMEPNVISDESSEFNNNNWNIVWAAA